MSLEEYLEVSVPRSYDGDQFVLVYYSSLYEAVDVLHYDALFFSADSLREFGGRLARTQRVPIAYFFGADERLAADLLHYAPLLSDHASVCEVVSRLGG